MTPTTIRTPGPRNRRFAATLGALIGAGGYGQPILTGIRRANLGLILEGTVPAAVLTILALGLLEGLERGLLPRSMQS